MKTLFGEYLVTKQSLKILKSSLYLPKNKEMKTG